MLNSVPSNNNQALDFGFDFQQQPSLSAQQAMLAIGEDLDKQHEALSISVDSNIANTTIFVGDLSIFVTEGDLVLAFQSYGAILDAKVMRCEETNKNLSYGFVKFSDTGAAVIAMQELNGKLLCGRPMRISWASHKPRKPEDIQLNPTVGNSFCSKPFAPKENYSIDSASIHASFTSEQLNYYIDEEVLRSVFERYGEVVDITIKKYDFDAVNQTQRGYAFIHFRSSDEGIEAAIRCTEELRNTVVGDARYKCDVSHKLMKELHIRKHPVMGELLQRYPSFLKIIQARETQANRNNGQVPSYMQSKQRSMNPTTSKYDSQNENAFNRRGNQSFGLPFEKDHYNRYCEKANNQLATSLDSYPVEYRTGFIANYNQPHLEIDVEQSQNAAHESSHVFVSPPGFVNARPCDGVADNGTKDRIFAVASPTWFNPWNHVMFPYASYASPAPFSPAPFAYSPLQLPMMGSPPGMNYVNFAANNVQAHHQSQKANGKKPKVSRFSFSERSDTF